MTPLAVAAAEELISVGMGEIKLTRDPQQVLVAYGLGSCICVCAYDPVLKLGGMLHALVPEHQNGQPATPKFADVGVTMLMEEMGKHGALLRRLVLKLAGGAQVLALPGMKDRFDIGARNSETALARLTAMGLRPVAIDVGGRTGRTVMLRVADGRVTVRSATGGQRDL